MAKKYWGSIGVAALIIVLVILFFCRSWLRFTVFPHTASVFYVHNVQAAFDQQQKALGDPLQKLGITSPTRHKGCDLQQAQSIHTEIDCSVMEQGYTKLATDDQSMAHLQQQAATIQSALKSQGWQSGSNGVTVTSLIDGIAKKVDYSPDAFYEKIIGRNDCTFDVMIAYANPAQPAIRVTLSCDRTVNMFGAPKNPVYTSAKWHF